MKRDERKKAQTHTKRTGNGITIQQFKSKPLSTAQCACVNVWSYDSWAMRRRISLNQNEITVRFYFRFRYFSLFKQN